MNRVAFLSILLLLCSFARAQSNQVNSVCVGEESDVSININCHYFTQTGAVAELKAVVSKQKFSNYFDANRFCHNINMEINPTKIVNAQYQGYLYTPDNVSEAVIGLIGDNVNEGQSLTGRGVLLEWVSAAPEALALYPEYQDFIDSIRSELPEGDRAGFDESLSEYGEDVLASYVTYFDINNVLQYKNLAIELVNGNLERLPSLHALCVNP